MTAVTTKREAGRGLLLVVLAALVWTSTAVAAFPIVRRIPTTRAQVVEHIRQSPGFHGGDASTPDAVTHIRCAGYHFNRARKAKTWRCAYRFTYPGDSQICRATYHGGYVQFRIPDGRLGMEWREDVTKDCSP